MNPSFDLRTQPFVPCLHRDGKVREHSLTDVLTQAHDLLELACDTPLQTVAVLRLLLAILYRTVPIYKKNKWVALWQQETLPADALTGYLNAQDGFDLFHPTRPFMQVMGMTMTNAAPLAVLATEAATGNNATLFDHRADDAPPAYSPAQAARMLLTAQAFALGFGKAAEASVGDKALPRPYLADAPALRGVTLFLSGASLRETLLLNMNPLREEQDDVLPPWEQPDPLADMDEVGKDGKRISVPAHGVVERYAWRSRMIRLLPDADGFVRRVYFTQGRAADKDEGDPMKLFVTGKKEEGRYALGLNAGKAAWRDLQTYLLPGKGNDTPILRFVGSLVQGPRYKDNPLPPRARYGLNVVGLATDPGKAGKFLLWRHDRMSLPAALLASDLLRGTLEQGMGDAESVADSLRQRIYRVASRFLPPDGNPDPNDVAHLMQALDPRPPFWARLETRFAHFVAGLDTEDAAQAALQAWREDVQREAARALRESCRLLGDSPRALKATADVSFGFIADRERLARMAAEAKTRKKANAKGGTP